MWEFNSPMGKTLGTETPSRTSWGVCQPIPCSSLYSSQADVGSCCISADIWAAIAESCWSSHSCRCRYWLRPWLLTYLYNTLWCQVWQTFCRIWWTHMVLRKARCAIRQLHRVYRCQETRYNLIREEIRTVEPWLKTLWQLKRKRAWFGDPTEADVWMILRTHPHGVPRGIRTGERPCLEDQIPAAANYVSGRKNSSMRIEGKRFSRPRTGAKKRTT